MAKDDAVDPMWVWGETANRPRLLRSMVRVRDAIELIQIRRSEAT